MHNNVINKLKNVNLQLAPYVALLALFFSYLRTKLRLQTFTLLSCDLYLSIIIITYSIVIMFLRSRAGQY